MKRGFKLRYIITTVLLLICLCSTLIFVFSNRASQNNVQTYNVPAIVKLLKSEGFNTKGTYQNNIVAIKSHKSLLAIDPYSSSAYKNLNKLLEQKKIKYISKTPLNIKGTSATIYNYKRGVIVLANIQNKLVYQNTMWISSKDKKEVANKETLIKQQKELLFKIINKYKIKKDKN